MKQNQPTDVQPMLVPLQAVSTTTTIQRRVKERHVIEESRAHGLVLARDPLRPASRTTAHRLARFDLWVCVLPSSVTLPSDLTIRSNPTQQTRCPRH